MSFRPATPPILQNPIEDADGDCDWYYDQGAGGYIFPFGKFKGKKIHETSISYLSWCDQNFDSNSPFKQAYQTFYNGLLDYARTNYGDFIVPFGRKHQGSKISDCQDKPWLLWSMTVNGLREKYDIFFLAVQYWLANPNHQEVHRDIGELLDASKYEDDLDLVREADGSDEEPTQSDKEFIVDDDDQDLSKGEGHKIVSRRSKSIGSLSGSEDDDGSPASGMGDLSARTSRSTSPVSERLRSKPKQMAMRTRKRKGKEGTSRRTKKPFIVDDDDENGSEEYEPSDKSESDQAPDRTDYPSGRTGPIRRLRSKSNDSTKQKVHPYPTSRRKSNVKITSTASSSHSESDLPSTRRSPRKSPRKTVIQSSDASEEETAGEDQPFEPRTPSPARPSLSTFGSYEQGVQRSGVSDNRIFTIQDQYLENAQHPVDIPDNVQEALNVVVKYIVQQQSVFDGESALQGLSSLDISRSPNMTNISPSLGRIAHNLFNDSGLTHTPKPSPSKSKKSRPSIVNISESDEPVSSQPSKSNLASPNKTKRTQEQSPQSRKRRRTSSSDEYVPSTDGDNVASSATIRTPTRKKADTSLGTRTASQETEPGGSRPRPYVLLSPRSRRISGVE
ncbi:hypothetical protein GALMADRAFT_1158727 [Galerina marginata CBS 339.88]|uniref:Uncharacterized protein n=1 Tax=Galerina marginata (strain CBS 339.88) TaxID=685588 RepID=A0A067SF59_GALM3|nr:hypothetical protein GALMADRAFT_1158727 [Galerina marginata CBS 339.88]